MRIISGIARGTKLLTLEGTNTRPTLDRVKESLFNIINSELEDSIVLDLFSGSGALGLESLSRGAKLAIFCDNSKEANKIIRHNVEKTKMEDKSIIYLLDFKNALKKIKASDIRPDVIFLDPPYESNGVIEALNLILELELIKNNTVIIIETDEKERILKQIQSINLELYDVRKYGRVYLMFLRRKG